MGVRTLLNGRSHWWRIGRAAAVASVLAACAAGIATVPARADMVDRMFDDLFAPVPEGAVPSSRSEVALSFAPIVRRAAPSVVNIFTERRSRRRAFADDPFFDMFMRPPDMPRVESSLGSGVIVTEDGLVVTNFHVIEGAESIRVVTGEGRQYDASVVLTDKRSDLAALRLEGDERFRALPLADSDAIQIGDLVLAIGNPFGIGQTTTSGIISGLARARIADTVFGHFIQTDAPINPGNSGGALVDTRGALIGINTAIVSRSGGSNGIGFAVPSGMVRTVINTVERGEDRLRRPYIGARFSSLEPDMADALGMRRTLGALVVDLDPEGPFAEAGVKAGDLLLGIDGRPIEHPDALGYRLATRGVGQRVGFTLLSDGRRRDVAVEMIAAPERPPRDERLLSGRTPFSGARVANLSPALSMELERLDMARGVIVLDVERRSFAARLGLRPGDLIVSVNGAPVDSTAALQEINERAARGWDVLIERDGRRLRRRVRG